MIEEVDRSRIGVELVGQSCEPVPFVFVDQQFTGDVLGREPVHQLLCFADGDTRIVAPVDDEQWSAYRGDVSQR